MRPRPRHQSQWPTTEPLVSWIYFRFRGTADMAGPAAGLVPVANDPKGDITNKLYCVQLDAST